MTHRTMISGYAAVKCIQSSGNAITGDLFNFRLTDGNPRASRAVWAGIRRGWTQVSPWAEGSEYHPCPAKLKNQPRTSYGRFGNDASTGAY